MKSLLLMMTFFTRIPVTYPYDYDEKDFIKGVKFLPVIGLLIGILMYLPTLLAPYIHRPIIIVSIWALYFLLTGGLHIDGLADTFDGIFSYRSKEEMLRIMKDSRIGAFGVLGIVWLLILNLTLAYYTENMLLLLVPVVGRASAVFAASRSIYARSEGMGGAFIESCGTKEGVISIAFSLLLGSMVSIKGAIIPMGITFLGVAMLTKKISKILGGMTGDTIGATIEISQTLFMLSAYLLKSIII